MDLSNGGGEGEDQRNLDQKYPHQENHSPKTPHKVYPINDHQDSLLQDHELNEKIIQNGGGEMDVLQEGIKTEPAKNGSVLTIVQPHSYLPKPEAPPGIILFTCSNTPPPPPPRDLPRSKSMPESADENPKTTANNSFPNHVDIGRFFREKSNSLSAAITKRLSSFNTETNGDNHIKDDGELYVTEFNILGLKVTKNPIGRRPLHDLPGRASFFSRSNCRDCTAVRSLFREKKLNFVEINIDVFPLREKELVERTGSSSVPQIFFNEKLFGGLVALNSLRNSGMLEEKLEEMLGKKCPLNAPAPPAYGFDDDPVSDYDGEEKRDELVQAVRILRQKLPIQDRLMKMKIVKNCFSSAELIEVLIHHLNCDRTKALEIGRQLAKKHFIHHVFGENDFEDGNHFYRFLEHEPFIPKCYNFRGLTNDRETEAVDVISTKLTKIMSAILESYASDDHRHLDYTAISNSEEFRRYLNLIEDLQRLNILTLSKDEKLVFFLNLYNAMAIHAVIRIGPPGGMIDRRSFFSDFLYIIGGHPYSLTIIRDGILRGNRRAPFSLVKPLGGGDKRLELAFPKVNQLIHFGLCNATRSSPTVKFFSPKTVESDLRHAAREFFQMEGVQVDLAKRTVYLTRIIKWYSADFGQEKEILKWILNFTDATKAGLLTHLLGDGGSVKVVYQNFDWSVNT